VGASGADLTISIDTTRTLAISSGFSGFNAPQLRNAVEYFDPNFINATTALKPGWIRFPAGSASDAYDWSAGEIDSTWMNSFSSVPNLYSLLTYSQKLTQAKGGVKLSDFATFANQLGAAAVICFNGFTDTNPQSTKNMALAAQGYRLNVAAWELTNEPYLFVPRLFATPSAFAAAMNNPYYDIVSVVPDAVVSVPFAGQFPGYAGNYSSWDNELAAYGPKFWNAVALHIYPMTAANLSPSSTRAFLNGVLAHGSTDYINSLLPLIGNNTPIFVTEFNSTANRSVASQTYLYNGIFLVEYILRLSSHPNVKRIGVHALYMGKYFQSGMIQAVWHDYETYLINTVYPNSVNTSGWGFGFFTTAPGLALQVAHQAINNSSNIWPTALTGGPVVPISGYDGQPVAAIYAQAYQGVNGKRYLVITNKSSVTQSAAIQANGTNVEGPFRVFCVSSDDPTVANTASSPQNVQIVSSTSTGLISLPGYSVTRVEW
jgi:hypothetical protein